MKKIAVILAGCGVYDGAEIHEAVLTLLAIKKNGAEYAIFAPDIDQYHVINHLTGNEMPERRNVLIESARIARGKISSLITFNAKEFDALILPGGFGAAKNLCSYAIDGADAKVNPEVKKAVGDMISLKKPVGALCIAPVILAKILGNHIEITIGRDAGTAADIEKMGGLHKPTGHAEIVVDRKYKIVTSPCYMLDASIDQVWEGADKTIKAILGLI
jgi:enhancing lycopene biosynthesis protein 2